MKKMALVTACAFALGGCAHMAAHHAQQSTVAAARVKQASLAVKQARAHGALWLATPHLLAVARKADAQGHYAQAIATANKVILQCRTAEKQAAANLHAKPYYPN